LADDSCIVAVVSDLHTNSTTGLCTPYFEHEGGQHKANAGQRWLWRNWLDYWQVIANLKANTSLPVLAIINGDAHAGVVEPVMVKRTNAWRHTRTAPGYRLVKTD
jgi:hypothetical protein